MGRRGFLMRHRRLIGHLAMRDRTKNYPPPGDALAGCIVLIVSAVASLAAVAWRVTRLDLVSVLKARE